jgi:hypothetical protein
MMETGPKKPNITRLSRWAWLWWLFIIGLMVWNVWALLPATRPEVNIPYTAFLAQVRADNV